MNKKNPVVHLMQEDGYNALCGVSHPYGRTDSASSVTCKKCLQCFYPNLSSEDVAKLNRQPTNAELLAKIKVIEGSLREIMYTLLDVLNKLKEK